MSKLSKVFKSSCIHISELESMAAAVAVMFLMEPWGF